MTSNCLRITAISLFAACAVVSFNCSPSDSKTSSEGTPILSGKPNTTYPMPPFNAFSSNLGWTLSEGTHASIQDYQGKILVLDFYATWCAPCRNSIPHLKALQQRFASAGLQVVGLNVGGADDRIKVAEFANELSIQYPLGFPDKPLSDLVLSDDDSIPQTFVFDREGKLMKRFIGYDESTAQQLDQVIQSAIATGQK